MRSAIAAAALLAGCSSPEPVDEAALAANMHGSAARCRQEYAGGRLLGAADRRRHDALCGKLDWYGNTVSEFAERNAAGMGR
ncbi:hypothetical protein [Sphingomonas sp.]|uniref:hypothetical protein n=1 Tax=Sphingomonas sp. TaxID=28214 RepID=UPI003CC55B86